MRPYSNWWESPLLWGMLACISVIPFAFVNVPPLTDLPNHIARYHIFLNFSDSPFFQNYYDLHWRLIGNLGVDGLVRIIGPALGAERAAWVLVAAIPPLTVAGLYALSRALNGKVSPAALAATPLCYNWPFNTGFVNFNLSAAMAMLVLALWIRLRAYPRLLTIPLFLVLGFLTWLAHAAGWGLLVLGVFGFEIARALESRPRNPLLVPFLAARATLPVAAMLAVTVLWRSSAQTGFTINYADNIVAAKITAFVTLFREYNFVWDMTSTAIFIALLGAFFILCRGRLVLAASLIFVFYLLAIIASPDQIFMSGFLDRRLLPYAVFILPLCIRLPADAETPPSAERGLSVLASLSIFFFLSRMAFTAVVWANWNTAAESRLAVLHAIPEHSRIFSLVLENCERQWPRITRPDHLQTMAVVRRDAAVNSLFQGQGLNQVETRFPKTDRFDPNMLAVVHDEKCPAPYIRETLQSAIAGFPRDVFDYVWILSDDAIPVIDESGLTLAASAGHDRLYRISSDTSP